MSTSTEGVYEYVTVTKSGDKSEPVREVFGPYLIWAENAQQARDIAVAQATTDEVDVRTAEILVRRFV